MDNINDTVCYAEIVRLVQKLSQENHFNLIDIEHLATQIYDIIYQNLYIYYHILKNLKNLGCAILVGHPRKSYISAFYNSKASERDLETITISTSLTEHGADYL
ncbi:Folate synthesis bifunctional protein [Rickettsia akari str. Hartford]|uniref:Folate synthesis bifunctional protein n=2 Tax=Rickettsia akari TaxID=786 RepID=A8GLV0_RICAH|nr:Folate synthesis bifunctional protein [Rickettsia akari str. Hartford]